MDYQMELIHELVLGLLASPFRQVVVEVMVDLCKARNEKQILNKEGQVRGEVSHYSCTEEIV